MRIRIFSNFDTSYKNKTVAKYTNQYGEENICFMSKSKLFWFLYIFLPLFIYFVGSALIIWWLYSFFDMNGVYYVGIPVLVLWLIALSKPVILHYIDYKMDFTIVTPKALIRYNQHWIIDRHIKTIDAVNLRTVFIQQKWLLYSIFNNWDIIFLSEWEKAYGEIRLEYIYKPEKNRRIIAKIIRGI